MQGSVWVMDVGCEPEVAKYSQRRSSVL